MRSACLRALPRRAALSLVPAVLALLFLDPPAVSCDVLLNEILAGPARDWNGDGAVSSRDDEWVEILNTGPGTVDLSAYYVTDADSTVRFAFTGSLAPGQRRLVFGLEAVDWQRARGRTIAGLSLNNTGDIVRLFRVAGTDTVMVDSYGYKSHEGATDRACGRRPDGATWALFDGLNPYTGALEPPATGCLPTPGAANVCNPTGSQAATWGRIKGAYR